VLRRTHDWREELYTSLGKKYVGCRCRSCGQTLSMEADIAAEAGVDVRYLDR
jgi:hypothetical protein